MREMVVQVGMAAAIIAGCAVAGAAYGWSWLYPTGDDQVKRSLQVEYAIDYGRTGVKIGLVGAVVAVIAYNASSQ